MTYQDIQTFQQRLQAARPTSVADINARLLEEIAELRHFIELRLLSEQQKDFSQKESNT